MRLKIKLLESWMGQPRGTVIDEIAGVADILIREDKAEPADAAARELARQAAPPQGRRMAGPPENKNLPGPPENK
jgi:hypothetical protein